MIQEDAWSALRSFTQARIALGRTGTALPLAETLQFRLAHAHARDAVYSALDIEGLRRGLTPFGLPVGELWTTDPSPNWKGRSTGLQTSALLLRTGCPPRLLISMPYRYCK